MKILIITGARCSGVGMVGVISKFCGAEGGRIPGFRAHDVRIMEQKPFDGRGPVFENQEIRNSVVKPMFHGLTCDPLGLRPIPPLKIVHELAPQIGARWARRVKMILLSEAGRVGSDTTYFYASEQACLLWPIWNQAFPDAHWIIVRRSDKEILGATMSTAYIRRSLENPKASKAWLDHHLACFEEIRAAVGDRVREVWTEKLIAGEMGELAGTIQWCGLDWDLEGVHDLVAPILWKAGTFK